VLELLVVVAGIAVIALGLLWLIGLPGDDDDDEELAGFVTANWDRVKGWVDRA
jgi:hypothetical protein